MSTPSAGLEIDDKRCRYAVSHEAILSAGLVLAPDDSSPPFVWLDGLLSRDEASQHEPHQRINKIPGMDYICYKSIFFMQLNELRRLFPAHLNVYPKTFLLPREFLEFQREHTSICSRTQIAPTWVIKPGRNSCGGDGIVLVQSVHEVESLPADMSAVCQLYVDPFLLHGKKFDFRFYVLISGLDPLTFFLYKEGIARFCTEPYQPPTRSNKDHRFAHLTNTHINVENNGIDPVVFTRRATEVLGQLARYDPSRVLWRRICDATRAAIIGVLPLILGGLPNAAAAKKLPKAASIKVAETPTTLPPPVVSKKQSALVIADDAQETLVVGAITNYQIVNPPRGKANPRKRVEGVSPDRKKRIIVAPKPVPRDPPRIRIEADEEAVVEAAEEEGGEKPKALKVRKRYWHVLGIDIILNANLDPVVLELNDRPSLMVTVPFEHDLKVKLLRDCFFHVDANGESHGDCEESDWQQIFPITETGGGGGAGNWAALLEKASVPVGPGNALASSSATNRMVSSGVRQSWHEENRQRFIERKEGPRLSRFVPYSGGNGA